MLYGIVSFYKSLINLKTQANEQKIFAEWIYSLYMFLMVFFLAGYITVGIVFGYTSIFTILHLIIALVFFFGAVFACVMVAVLKHISAALTKNVIIERGEYLHDKI
jgi:hypothetical protein